MFLRMERRGNELSQWWDYQEDSGFLSFSSICLLPCLVTWFISSKPLFGLETTGIRETEQWTFHGPFHMYSASLQSPHSSQCNSQCNGIISLLCLTNTLQPSICWHTYEQKMVYPYNGIFFSPKKEQSTDSCYKMDKSWMYNTHIHQRI